MSNVWRRKKIRRVRIPFKGAGVRREGVCGFPGIAIETSSKFFVPDKNCQVEKSLTLSLENTETLCGSEHWFCQSRTRVIFDLLEILII